jgi:hypothetical protein
MQTHTCSLCVYVRSHLELRMLDLSLTRDCILLVHVTLVWAMQLFCVGDKSRAQIARDYKSLMTLTMDSCFDKDAIFPLVG